MKKIKNEIYTHYILFYYSTMDIIPDDIIYIFTKNIPQIVSVSKRFYKLYIDKSRILEKNDLFTLYRFRTNRVAVCDEKKCNPYVVNLKISNILTHANELYISPTEYAIVRDNMEYACAFEKKVNELNLDLLNSKCNHIKLTNIRYISQRILNFLEENPVSEDEHEFVSIVENNHILDNEIDTEQINTENISDSDEVNSDELFSYKFNNEWDCTPTFEPKHNFTINIINGGFINKLEINNINNLIFENDTIVDSLIVTIDRPIIIKGKYEINCIKLNNSSFELIDTPNYNSIIF